MDSSLLTSVFELQRQIYSQIGDYIRAFANGGGWVPLLAVLPMGIVFGAVHAMTPGHSKAVLATYVAGSPMSALRALATSLTLSATHVSSALLIGAFSLPLVSVALGSVGQAPFLESISRMTLACIGAWMLWRAFRRAPHRSQEGEMFGLFAGLIPCPLTLFVMSFAISRGVPEAGLVFALAMMVGVALILSGVALLSVLLRDRLQYFLEVRAPMLNCSRHLLEGAAGIFLLILALTEIAS